MFPTDWHQVTSKPKYAKMNSCFGRNVFMNDPRYLVHANGAVAMHPHEFHSDVGCTGLGNCSGHCHSLGGERADLCRTGDQTSLETGLGTDHCLRKTTTPHVAGLASVQWTGNGWIATSLTARGCLHDGSSRYGLKTTSRLWETSSCPDDGASLEENRLAPAIALSDWPCYIHWNLRFLDPELTRLVKLVCCVLGPRLCN